ncbi:hypothetical protein [Lewinella sp. IMCC34191]|uniref:hypothetical protein n=1 Tax=Lewinella sp. IMCC34191 TaxID=2259172 RepID=UPI000E288B88|nr:hypothetical protein [Lewinella sp. IMCC34191]
MRWTLFLLPLWLTAQRSAPLNADFRFQDGVYFSAEALLANEPDVDWGEIAGEMVQLPEDFRVQIDSFGYKTRRYVKPYAIGLDGLPYLFVRQDGGRAFHEFTGLRQTGRYATIRYDTIVHTRQLMRAYNPATGNPFREGWVERDRRQEVSRVVDMATGRRHPLEILAVSELVDDEKEISDAVLRLTNDDQQKLVRALVLYNERHPLLIPLPQATD